MNRVLGPELVTQFGSFNTIDGGSRSEFFPGWQGYFVKDLRTQLGDKFKSPFKTRFCGAGNIVTCRADMWAAVQATYTQLAAEQGPDPAAWRADAVAERKVFAPGLLKTTMRFANRPSGIQQVISFKGHRAKR